MRQRSTRPTNPPPAGAPSRRSRRQFLQTLGVTTALPLVAALPDWAKSQTTTPGRQIPPGGAAPLTSSQAEDDANIADSRSLLEIVKRRYGGRFTEAELFDLRSYIENTVASGRSLRKFELQNSDAPDIVFRVRPPGA